MRLFEVRFIPEGGTFHVFDEVVAPERDIERVAIHKMKLVDEEVGVVLYELRGDVDRFRELMGKIAAGYDYQITEFDDSIFFYSPFRVNDLLHRLMRITRDFELFRMPPMTFNDSGDLCSTYVGTEEVFEEAMASAPEEITVVLDRKIPYKPDAERAVAQLTQKQRAILEAAVEFGYYDVPRRATYKDIGEELDLSGATVGEHLRKAEKSIMYRLASEL